MGFDLHRRDFHGKTVYSVGSSIVSTQPETWTDGSRDPVYWWKGNAMVRSAAQDVFNTSRHVATMRQNKQTKQTNQQSTFSNLLAHLFIFDIIIPKTKYRQCASAWDESDNNMSNIPWRWSNLLLLLLMVLWRVKWQTSFVRFESLRLLYRVFLRKSS